MLHMGECFISVLFIVAKYPSTDKWINEIWQIQLLDIIQSLKWSIDSCNIDETWKSYVKLKKQVIKDFLRQRKALIIWNVWSRQIYNGDRK
jgi:hypothetical protein